MVNKEENLVEHYDVLGNLKDDFRNSNLFVLVASKVTGNYVVDIGCGGAFFGSVLLARGKHVVGLEPSEGMREMAKRFNPEVKVIAGDAEEVDVLVEEPVETVVMLDVLEHIEKDAEQIEKIGSILKTGGEFIFVVPCHPFLYGERDKQVGHYRRYSSKMLRKILENNGFRIEYLRHWNVLGFLPYLISEKILRRPLESKLRRETKAGTFSVMVQKGLNFWFSQIENNFDFGFGLSIIGVARKVQI